MNSNHPESSGRFEDPIAVLERTRRHRHLLRTTLHSRPRKRTELETRPRLRWVLGAVIALGLAVALGFLVPT